MTTKSSVLLLLGVAVLGGAAETRAVCTGSGSAGTFSGYTYIASPGVNTPDSIESAFWALGFGNPAAGSGVDNGAWEDNESTPNGAGGWLQPFASANFLFGAWSDSSAVDGCILGRVAPGKAREIMVIAFSDQGPAPSYLGGFFGVAAVQRTSPGPVDFDFTFAGMSEFRLVAIPRPIIAGSWRPPAGGIGVEVRGPTIAEVLPGIVSDGSVTASELVLGYRVYAQTFSSPGPTPSDRRIGSGWIRVADVTPLGQNASIILPTPCHGTVFALSLVFESGFETQHVSSNSTMIQTRVCDPAFDFDSDGYNPDPCCAPSDCDDGNQAVHPGATETCNGIDDDCDGLVDETVDGTDSDSDGVPNLCDDCAMAYNPGQHDLDDDGEGDVCDLDDGLILVGFGQPSEVSWQPESGFLAWNLYRGDLRVLASTGIYTQIPGSNELARRDCDLTLPQAPDTVVPDSGSVAFSLVSGETIAGEGSLGSDSEGVERPNTQPCP